MKYLKFMACILLSLALLPLSSLAGSQFPIQIDKREKWIDSRRHVIYYQVEVKDDALRPAAQKINQAIMQEARISEYIRLLSTVQSSGTGLVVDGTVQYSGGLFREGKGYLSIVMEAEGKMLEGRPSHRYYPMTFNVETGERVLFDDLFSDPQGARDYIEDYLLNVVEPQLSAYMENNQLFPVPYDSFGFSDDGHLILYYPHDQFSFLSGTSGAVAFRFSELWDYLDTSENCIALSIPSSGIQYQQYAQNRTPEEMQEIITQSLRSLQGLDHVCPSLGHPMELVLRDLDITVDSGYYPGGAYFETEKPELLFTYLISDPTESYISGILSSRVDMYGIETGKTALDEAIRLLGEPLAQMTLSPDVARMYLVCPGTMITYQYMREHPINLGNTNQFTHTVSLTLYADEAGIVQYIKLSL